LCYVAHLIGSNIDEQICRKLQNWLKRMGRIFSKQPKTFNSQQFLVNFRTPNMIDKNHSFYL
jgi:hypothetical protein